MALAVQWYVSLCCPLIPTTNIILQSAIMEPHVTTYVNCSKPSLQQKKQTFTQTSCDVSPVSSIPKTELHVRAFNSTYAKRSHTYEHLTIVQSHVCLTELHVRAFHNCTKPRTLNGATRNRYGATRKRNGATRKCVSQLYKATYPERSYT